MKRETGLLTKGVNNEIVKILRDFDEIMNATMGDTVKIHTAKEVITRKATLEDTIDFMKSEWNSTKEQLNELGIEFENIENLKEIGKQKNENIIDN